MNFSIIPKARKIFSGSSDWEKVTLKKWCLNLCKNIKDIMFDLAGNET